MSALFSKFQVRYGHKWTSAMPTEELTRLAVSEWSGQLGGLTGDDVRRGLDAWREDWPPSAPQFRRCCLAGNDVLHKGAAYKPFVRLPKPQRDKRVGSAALADMRKGFA